MLTIITSKYLAKEYIPDGAFENLSFLLENENDIWLYNIHIHVYTSINIISVVTLFGLLFQ